MIAVLVENGGGGRVAAAPVAEKMFRNSKKLEVKKLFIKLKVGNTIQRRVMNQLHIDLPLILQFF
ncbi:MAG: hypothetical protein Ct9H90mP13_00240 [Pseudomonadota bacterium]|nr:MAG: hypothetical protein Ct9H90mP13_00240 [Pseudomonadota bacterium]